MTVQHDPVARYIRASIFLLVLAAGAAAYFYFFSERGQHAMRRSGLVSTSGLSRPLIDSAQPKETATATFAMG